MTLLDWAETAHESLKARPNIVSLKTTPTTTPLWRWSPTPPGIHCSCQRLFVTSSRTTFLIGRHYCRRRDHTRRARFRRAYWTNNPAAQENPSDQRLANLFMASLNSLFVI